MVTLQWGPGAAFECGGWKETLFKVLLGAKGRGAGGRGQWVWLQPVQPHLPVGLVPQVGRVSSGTGPRLRADRVEMVSWWALVLKQAAWMHIPALSGQLARRAL